MLFYEPELRFKESKDLYLLRYYTISIPVDNPTATDFDLPDNKSDNSDDENDHSHDKKKNKKKNSCKKKFQTKWLQEYKTWSLLSDSGSM